jgi:hypothetical protein
VNRALIAGALMLLAGATCATELPVRKVGLWETRMQYSSEGKTVSAPVSQRCLDEAGVARAKLIADEYIHKNCPKYEVRQEGATWVVDMVCKAGAGTTTSHTVTAFANANAYHSELTMSHDPPSTGPATRTVVDGQWLGACKAE